MTSHSIPPGGVPEPPRAKGSPYRDGFACGWDEINGKRASWKTNPWVWVVVFRWLAER